MRIFAAYVAANRGCAMTVRMSGYVERRLRVHGHWLDLLSTLCHSELGTPNPASIQVGASLVVMDVLGSSSGALRTETQYLEGFLRVAAKWRQSGNKSGTMVPLLFPLM